MIPRRSTARVNIHRTDHNRLSRRRDVVVIEEPLEIRLKYNSAGQRLEQSIAVTMRTPGEDFHLAAGFLFSEGIIQSAQQILEMSYCVGLEKERQAFNKISVELADGVLFDPARLQRNFYATSSCGVCGKASLEALELQGCRALDKDAPVFLSKQIYALPKKIRAAQNIFEKTGGLHAAALFNASGDLKALYEDVGRHNAVDKLIGEQFLAHKLPLSNALLFVSGRASFEIMQKALMAGIPVVAAVGAPSSLAVDLAKEFAVTLLGFVREESFNIYTSPERILMNSNPKELTA